MSSTKTEYLLKNKSLVESAVRQQRYLLSAYSFVNIFLWKDFFEFRLEVIEHALCVFAKNEMGCFMYLPPLGGNLSRAVIDRCFVEMEAVNRGNGVTRIENFENKRSDLFPEKEFETVLKSRDYCYFREDIVALKGNPYKSQRNEYNRFVADGAHRFLPFDPSMTEECASLYDRWACAKKKNSTDDVFVHMIEENRSVHRLAMQFYQELELTGYVATVNGAIRGYTFGFALNKDILCVLMEIADPGMDGLPVFLFREFCRSRELQGFPFINAMDDFNMPNIRATKMSFHPIILVPSYNVACREETFGPASDMGSSAAPFGEKLRN